MRICQSGEDANELLQEEEEDPNAGMEKLSSDDDE